MKVSELIVLGVVASCSAGFCRAAAQALIGASVSPNGNGGGTRTELPSYQKEINRRLCAALIAYPEMSDKPALVYVPINKDGAIAGELIFTQMTGSLEADFACYDAIMSLAPFYSLSLPRSSNYGYSFYSAYSIPFGMTTGNKISNSDTRIVSSYFKSHPKLAGKVLLIRSIPPSVLYRYPGVFTDVEVDSARNIKGVKLSMFDIRLQKQAGHFAQVVRNKRVIERYRDWENFERNHATATKKQILDFAKMLDVKYAEIFEE